MLAAGWFLKYHGLEDVGPMKSSKLGSRFTAGKNAAVPLPPIHLSSELTQYVTHCLGTFVYIDASFDNFTHVHNSKSHSLPPLSSTPPNSFLGTGFHAPVSLFHFVLILCLTEVNLGAAWTWKRRTGWSHLWRQWLLLIGVTPPTPTPTVSCSLTTGLTPQCVWSDRSTLTFEAGML